MNRGLTPAGVTGLLDLTGNAQYVLYVTAWKRSLNIPTIPRPGRGLPRWEAFRRLNVGSVISFRANITGGPGVASGFPTPVIIENSSGSVTIQFDTGKTVTFTGDVIGYAESLDEKKQENWIIGVTLKLTTRPVYVGFGGTQATPSAATVQNQQTDPGLQQTYDPTSLRNTASQRIDIGTIADTDVADLAQLKIYVASGLATTSAPIPNLIPRTGQFLKTDRAGGAISVEWGTRSTTEDVTFPESFNRVDPYLLDSVAASAIINHISSGLPGVAGIPTGLQIVSVENQKIDRVLQKTKYDFGVTNSVQKVQIAGTDSLRSGIQADRDAITVLQNSTATDQVFASATYLSIGPTTPNLLNLMVKSQDPYRKKVTQNLINPGIQVLSISSGGARYVEYQTSGSTIYVWVQKNDKYGDGGFRRIQLSRQNVWNKPIRRFILSRMRFVAPPIPEYATQFGTTNAATFLGLSAGTVKYNSCSDSTKLITPTPANQAFFLGYHFESDALGFIQQLPENWFRQPIYCATSVTTEGAWVDASTLNLPLASPLALATTSDFNNFLISP